MDIKIEMLRCFAEVARQGNLADAAERLGRSPSAVSMMLKQFQQQLGQPLFTSDRKTELTPLGVFVLEQARAELDHFAQTKRSIAAYLSGGGPLLRVGMVPSASRFVPQVIAGVLRAMPDLRFSLRDQDSEQVLRGLAEGDLDVGIATAPERMFRAHRQTLFGDPYGVVGQRGHPLIDAAMPPTVGDLRVYRFISNPLVAASIDPELRDVGDAAQISVTNTLSMLALVEAGVGITVLPRTAVEATNPRVGFRPLRCAQPDRQVDLLFPTQRTLTDAQRVFGEMLKRFEISLRHIRQP